MSTATAASHMRSWLNQDEALFFCALSISRLLASLLFGRWLLGGSGKTTTFRIAETRQEDLGAQMRAEGQIRSVIAAAFR